MHKANGRFGLPSCRLPRSRSMSTRRPSKRLARSVALVGEQAHAAGAGTTMTRDAGVGRRGGLLGQPLPPQLLHAAADRRENVTPSALAPFPPAPLASAGSATKR